MSTMRSIDRTTRKKTFLSFQLFKMFFSTSAFKNITPACSKFSPAWLESISKKHQASVFNSHISKSSSNMSFSDRACMMLDNSEKLQSADSNPKSYNFTNEFLNPSKLEMMHIDSNKTKSKSFFRRPLPSSVVDFSSPKGKNLFAAGLITGYLESYFKLAGQYHAQTEPSFCGLTVLCMVLNSLEFDPARVWKNPWRWYSENMLSCCISLSEIKKSGVDFDQFNYLARCQGANIVPHRYNTRSLKQFREDIQSATSSSSHVMVLNYARSVIGQTGSGHFAPVGGYSPSSDMVLLFDVARFKYPPHWVPLSLLYYAMEPEDPSTGKTRGYFIISKGKRVGNFCENINVDENG